jgi:hypothetical protein
LGHFERESRVLTRPLFGNVTPQEALDQKQPHEPEQEFELEMGM